MGDGEPTTDERHRRLIEAQLNELTERYDLRYSDEEREQVRRDIARSLTLAAKVRSATLTNADEPAGLFVPYRETP